MKIQILYFEGCPNHPPAVELVREVVSTLHVEATIEEVEVKSPEDSERLHFLGSPSILVDGLDIEPNARIRKDFGDSCRTYNGEGLPPRDMLISALKGDGYISPGRAISLLAKDCC